MALFGGITLPNQPDLDNVRKLDAMILPQLNRMSRYGIAIDREYLWELGSQFDREKQELNRDISAYVPEHALDQFSERAAEIEEEEGSVTLNASSADQIRTLLFDLLSVGRDQKLKTTGSGAISTGRKNLDLCRDDHPVVPLILQYRERAKLKSAFCDALPKAAKLHPRGDCCPVCELPHEHETWRLHTEFMTTRAITGRLSCTPWWTSVQTIKGPRLISSIKTGDLVFTHRHRYRAVTAVQRKGREDMYTLQLSNGYRLTCTLYHRLLVSSYERLEVMGIGREEYSRGSGPVSVEGLSESGRDREAAEHDLPECQTGVRESHSERRVQGTCGDTMVALEAGREEPHVREIWPVTSQLDRSGGRWVRVSDLLERWKETVRSPDRDGGSAGYEGTAGDLRRSPYRRGHEEQQYRQSGTGDQSGSSATSLPNDERFAVHNIEEITYCGCFEVYDLTVDEDESYVTEGVFSHNSRRPNLQQIPIRTDLGSRIRAAFIASPGCKLVSVDFSQMEIRDLAHLADARSMIDIYALDGDIHMNTAMKAFGISDPKLVDKYKHRLPSKRTNFGIQNGTTEKGLYAQLVGDYWASGKTPPPFLTPDWCKQFIVDWHRVYPEVQPYFDTRYYLARRYGFVWDPWGRVRYIPQVRSSLPYKVHEGLREAQNFAVTASNAEQTKLAMAECEELFTELLDAGVWVWPLLSIHDQVIAEAETDYADSAGDGIVRIFEHVMDDRDTGERLWRCPIKSDCEILDRWKSKE